MRSRERGPGTAGPSFAELAGEIGEVFDRDPSSVGDETFNRLALRVFELQCRENSTYGAFARGRGAEPGRVGRWEDVPAVPATAFKHLDLFVGDPAGAEAVFRTSGTTRGVPGRHLVKSLTLYRGSLLPPFRRHLLPDGVRLPLLALVPPPDALPDSSLSYMVGTVAKQLSTGATWLLGPSGRVDADRFVKAAAVLREGGEPALVVGTALALLDLVETLGRPGSGSAALPAGSRIMETGGFKGRTVEVTREDLYAGLTASLGVPADRIVNEYGMTELLSQLYEPALLEGAAGRGRHVPPPWLRVRALDPVSLRPVPAGEDGLLAFFDLANVGSVSHVLTEDVGSVSADGVRLVGRVLGSEPRGCSLAVEELRSLEGTRP